MVGSNAFLVGGWTNPSEKYARQNGNLPQIGVKIKNVWNHHLDFLLKVRPFLEGSFVSFRVERVAPSTKAHMDRITTGPDSEGIRKGGCPEGVLGGSSQDGRKWLVIMVILSPLTGVAYKWGLLTTYDTWDDPPSVLPNLKRPAVFSQLKSYIRYKMSGSFSDMGVYPCVLFRLSTGPLLGGSSQLVSS